MYDQTAHAAAVRAARLWQEQVHGSLNVFQQLFPHMCLCACQGIGRSLALTACESFLRMDARERNLARAGLMDEWMSIPGVLDCEHNRFLHPSTDSQEDLQAARRALAAQCSTEVGFCQCVDLSILLAARECFNALHPHGSRCGVNGRCGGAPDAPDADVVPPFDQLEWRDAGG